MCISQGKRDVIARPDVVLVGEWLADGGIVSTAHLSIDHAAGPLTASSAQPAKITAEMQRQARYDIAVNTPPICPHCRSGTTV
ncbi:MAG: hypothetical protein ABR902_03095 [Candidatus Korobacteraceae bacterium]